MKPQRKQPATLLLSLSALVLVGTLALLASTDRRAPPAAGPEDRAAATPAALPPRALSGPSEHAGARTSPDPSARPTVAAGDEGAAAEDAGGTLLVRVADEEGAPLPGVRVVLALAGSVAEELRQTEGSRGGPDAWLRTDHVGEVAFSTPSRSDGTLWAFHDEPGHEPLERAVRTPEPFGQETVELVLRRRPSARLERRLVDAETGEPVAGARVTLRRERAPHEPRQAGGDPLAPDLAPDLAPGDRSPDDETLDATVSGAAGAFALAWPPWIEGFLQVEARGYTPVALAPREAEPPDPVPLRPTATLTLRILGDGRGMAAALVRLDAPLADASLGAPDGALGRRRITLEESCDPEGRARIGEAPAGRPITLGARYGDWTLGTVEVAPLAPGEEREVTWILPPSAALEGTLRDEAGEPIGGQELWLLPAADGRERYLTCDDLARPTTARRTTDAAGRFRFERVLPGRWLLGPGAECEERGASRNPRAIAPWASLLALDADGPWSVELERPLGLTVEGVVRDQGGRIAKALVLVSCEGGGREELVEGSFRLGPFADRTHRVTAHSLVRGLSSEPLSVRPVPAGSRVPLELVLRSPWPEPDPGAVVSGFVVDGATGAPLDARVTAVAASEADASLVEVDLSSPHGRFLDRRRRFLEPDAEADAPVTAGSATVQAVGGDGARPSARTDALGRFRLEGVAPGVHVLYVRAAQACATLRIVVPRSAARVRDLLVAVPPPARLVVVDEGDPAARGDATIRVDATFLVRGPWRSGEPLLVPAGRWALELSREGEHAYREMASRPAEEVVLRWPGP